MTVARLSTDVMAQLMNVHDKKLRDAFLSSVADIRNAAVVSVVVSRLERGDVLGAVEALQVEPEAYAKLEQALTDAYNAGGGATVDQLPAIRDEDRNRVLFRWGIRNTVGEAWLRDYSASMVTRIADDQREAIRAAFTGGLMLGDNPRQTTINVIGRISRATGKREGGVIGLTSPQEQFVSNARAELSSGDEARMADYLERGRRDKRFDAVVRQAIKDGKKLDAETVSRIVGRYADRLLQLRGDSIGLNETMTALARSRKDAIAIQIISGKLDAQDVRKVWKHTPQEHPRLSHVAMNGKSVRWDEMFVLPDGTQIDYPHAPDAPAKDTIFCKCHFMFKIDYLAPVVRRHQQRAA